MSKVASIHNGPAEESFARLYHTGSLAAANVAGMGPILDHKPRQYTIPWVSIPISGSIHNFTSNSGSFNSNSKNWRQFQAQNWTRPWGQGVEQSEVIYFVIYFSFQTSRQWKTYAWPLILMMMCTWSFVCQCEYNCRWCKIKFVQCKIKFKIRISFFTMSTCIIAILFQMISYSSRFHGLCHAKRPPDGSDSEIAFF